ncbi:MAG: alkaline phosphatase family protein [Alphaproteobacteria bacterium]
MTEQRRLMVLALDAMDRDLALKWAEAGVLPALKSLMNQGTIGHVDTPLLETGSVWPSFHMGADPSVHGLYDGTRHFDPETYTHPTYEREEVKQKPYWEALTKAGCRSIIIDPPNILPPENLNGIYVTDWLAHASWGVTTKLQLRTQPPELADRLMRDYDPDPMDGLICDFHRPRSAAEQRAFRDKMLRRAEIKTQFTIDMMENEQWDFMFSVLVDAHCALHHCWHLHDTSHPDYDPDVAKAVGDPVRDVYVKLDKCLADVLERVDERTVVVVWMSHAAENAYTGEFMLDRVLQAIDSRSTENHDARNKRLRRLWHKVPLDVRKVLTPVHVPLRRRLYGEGFLPHPEKRTFFEVYCNEKTAGIRINVAGRERDGVVQPGEEYDAVCAKLKDELMALRNEETGEPAVIRVWHRTEEFSGEQINNLPDLFVSWNRDKAINAVSSDRIGRIENPVPPVRTGDHTAGGWFAAIGPGVIPRQLNMPVGTIDFAPTFAAFFGGDTSGFQGKPIDPIVRPAD